MCLLSSTRITTVLAQMTVNGKETSGSVLKESTWGGGVRGMQVKATEKTEASLL